jgi:ABC-type branched-subunit amino acid transport system substrate-binding protein
LRDLKELSEGIYTVGTELDNRSSKNPKSMNLMKRIEQQFGRRADFNSGLGYDMAWIALESFHKSSNKMPSEVVSYILNKEYFEGASGKIYFNEKGDSKYNLYLLSMSNGVLVEVKDVE